MSEEKNSGTETNPEGNQSNEGGANKETSSATVPEGGQEGGGKSEPESKKELESKKEPEGKSEEDYRKEFHAKQDAEHKETVKSWKDEVEGRKEFKQEEVLVNNALEKFGSDELLKVFKESGYDRYPPLWNLLTKVGEALQNDKAEDGKSSGGKEPEKSFAQQMYPSMYE